MLKIPAYCLSLRSRRPSHVYCSSKEHIPKDSPLKDIVNTGYALEQLRQVKFSQFLTFALLTKVAIL